MELKGSKRLRGCERQGEPLVEEGRKLREGRFLAGGDKGL